MANIYDTIVQAYTDTGLIRVPYTLERFGASFGCHIINLLNQENKHFFHAGKLNNLREHIVIQAPSGFCKSVLLDFFLDPQFGLLSACPFPTSVEATFTPESWVGTTVKDPDNQSMGVTDGVLEQYKHGIVGADEYARFKTMAENPGDANDVVYLLKALDGNKVSKRMASVDKIQIDGICMTFWCGLRPTSLKFTSGLGRRFSYQMYFPTWEEAKAFKKTAIEGTADKGIDQKHRESIRDLSYDVLTKFKEKHEINSKETYHFLEENKLIPHFDINHYKRLAIGWSIIKGTYPEVHLDETMVGLFRDEFESRRMVRANPMEECLLKVIGAEPEGFDKNFLYAFMDSYYQMPRSQIKPIIRDLKMMERLEELGGKFHVPDGERLEQEAEQETVEELISI